MGTIRNMLTDPGSALTDPHATMAQTGSNAQMAMGAGGAAFPRGMSNKEWGRFQQFHQAQMSHDMNKFNATQDAMTSNATLAHQNNLALIRAQGDQQRMSAAQDQSHALNMQTSAQDHARGMQADAHDQGLVATSMAHQNRLETINTLGSQSSPVNATWNADGSGTFNNSAMASSPQQRMPGGTNAGSKGPAKPKSTGAL